MEVADVPEALSIAFGDTNDPIFGHARKTFTPLEIVGDGNFGTVHLCDWHSDLSFLSSYTTPIAGPGYKPEYPGMRVVAVKRMKRQWMSDEGDWKRLREIQALCTISRHPNIVPLLDAFVNPILSTLYLVFEALEGHLYQLIKHRQGRPCAGGLLASMLLQITRGIAHIHASGYMHRDIVPENILVTTFGLHEYPGLNDTDDPLKRDVLVFIKIADFGHARATASSPPYTEYVCVRWYRAPEAILKSRHYTAAMDAWSLACIMMELINMRPLFPGKSEVDQMERIARVLGDPSQNYRLDDSGREIGGGSWPTGVELGQEVGYVFPEHSALSISHLVDSSSAHSSLLDCISALLKWNPSARLTSAECLSHSYFIRASAYVDALPAASVQPPAA